MNISLSMYIYIYIHNSITYKQKAAPPCQESIAKRCIAQPGDVRKILTEWLHDCPDASAREQLVAKVELEVKEPAASTCQRPC